MNEAKLQEIEDRANEMVRRCSAGDDCDAPARWRKLSLLGEDGWFCSEHVEVSRAAHPIATVELDALDLVAEVRRMRGTS